MTDDQQALPSNSHSSRRIEVPKPEKKVERVTTGDAIERKKPFMKRVGESFTSEDTHSVAQFVMFEVALPAVKTMISDMVSQGIERLLFGGGNTASSSRRTTGSYTSYNRMYSGGAPKSEPRTMSARGRATFDFREIVVPSRGEAETVLDQLTELLRQYDVATVSDLYQLAGISGTFTEEKYGWTNLSTAAVRRVREGYLLDLPRPIALD